MLYYWYLKVIDMCAEQYTTCLKLSCEPIMWFEFPTKEMLGEFKCGNLFDIQKNLTILPVCWNHFLSCRCCSCWCCFSCCTLEKMHPISVPKGNGLRWIRVNVHKSIWCRYGLLKWDCCVNAMNVKWCIKAA